MSTDIKTKPVYFYSKLYPVVSNLIFFILGIYSFGTAAKPFVYNKISNSSAMETNKLMAFILVIFGILSILAGAFSVNYHMKTPSYTLDPSIKHEEDFKKVLELDNVFAMILFLYAVLVLVGYSVYYKKLAVLADGNLLTGIVFVVLSLLCYVGAGEFYKSSYEECDDAELMGCFRNHQTIYNMYHSSWHIFSGFAGFFWLLVIVNNFGTGVSIGKKIA